MKKQERNHCYTYFKITGDFNPDDVSERLGLQPDESWRIGDLRRNGTRYDFAMWRYGMCEDYDVFVENQMMKTIADLLARVDLLKEIKQERDVSFTLEIVPHIYAHSDESSPCLAPNREVVKFCYETETEIDIDLYVYDSADA